MNIPEGYVVGLVRDTFPGKVVSHLYKGSFHDLGLPMCKRGWNRDWGLSYSIWRGHEGAKGVCKICMRRALKGLDGVEAVANKDAPEWVLECDNDIDIPDPEQTMVRYPDDVLVWDKLGEK